MITLVLGGTRSGKSAMAESLLPKGGLYIATAEILDAEMKARIKAHIARRGTTWQTLEAPLDLAQALGRQDGPALVDCLTLWVSNLLLAGRDATLEVADVIEALKSRRSDTVLVSNEVGLGIVPDNALARDFRDRAGIVNQKIAAMADRVVFVAAGLPMVLKGSL
ncbi:MAG: bifunctional adenosylcobinamide kinase/adenosylcobinamide-phosphate guanylyltransferase [Alphaproteobacteria bacterium]|nr:bifunctional adenosylcobinamide kinase/adenosylcobinamide-phosphate guanylyltransferase [Alphaproteobacteria bacterium]